MSQPIKPYPEEIHQCDAIERIYLSNYHEVPGYPKSSGSCQISFSLIRYKPVEFCHRDKQLLLQPHKLNLLGVSQTVIIGKMNIDRLQFARHPELIKPEQICDLCGDVAMCPVECIGPCKSVYCRACASEWAHHSYRATCPKKCMEGWQFMLLPKTPVDVKCPNSDKCEIKYYEDFERHLKVCTHQPPKQNHKYFQITELLCEKDHRLKFVGDTRMIAPGLCVGCGLRTLLRSYCEICQVSYCKGCRNPPISQQGCNIGHHFRPTTDERVKCDVCGLAGSLVMLKTYEDSHCNISVCELCFQQLPRNRVESDRLNCKLGHLLLRRAGVRMRQCSQCKQVAPCWKECLTCETDYCIRCVKPPQNSNCGHNHICSISSNAAQECQGCGRQELVFLTDHQCRITKCLHCSLRLQIKGFIKCSSNHPLSFDNAPATQEICSKCKELKLCQLVCKRCRPAKVFCFGCIDCDLSQSCIYGHPYRNQDKQVAKNCSVCKKQQKVTECKVCDFCICLECTEHSKRRLKKRELKR